MARLQDIWTDRMLAAVPVGDIPVRIAQPQSPARGTVLLVHGRNGAPQQTQIAQIADAYLSCGWRVAAPELPHSSALPESGPPMVVTFSGHTRAARDVRDWMMRHWPGPHALAGHSIGAFAAGQLAGDGVDVHHLLAVSPPHSGQVLMRARQAMGQAAIDEVRRDAPAYFAEMATADARPALQRATCPVAVVTGACDGLIPLRDARDYFMTPPDGRFFGALPGEHHCPAGPACARMLAAALTALEV